MVKYYYRGNPGSSCCPSGNAGSVTTIQGGGSMYGTDSIVYINGDGYGGGQIIMSATDIDLDGYVLLPDYISAPYLYTDSSGYLQIGNGTPIIIGEVAGGDLSGYYPNPLVSGLQGRPVLSTAPTTGQALEWNGSAWAPANITSSIAGDVTGSLSASTVIKLQHNPIDSTLLGVSQNGYVLTWDNTDGYWAARTAPVSFSAGGDLTGTNTHQTVIGIDGYNVVNNLQDGYLFFNGTGMQWVPASDFSTVTMSGDVNGSSNSNYITNISGTGSSSNVNFNANSITASGNLIQYAPDGYVAITSPNSINLTTGSSATAGSGLYINTSQVDINLPLQITNNASANYLYTDSGGTIQSGTSFPVAHITGGTPGQFLLTGPSADQPQWFTLDGDVSWSNYHTSTVVGLYGTPIANTPPIIGDALVYNGTNYSPAPANGGGDFVSFLLMGA